MNRFEAMLASPMLSSKDMAMHVKMQTAIPREEANILRSEMFVPKVRLFDELTTLRFRRPGAEEENAFYRSFCKVLSGSPASPIPYRFFKAEFEQLLQDAGVAMAAGGSAAAQTARAKQAAEAVGKLTDPWRLQAYAALCARIALSSETEKPGMACKAWEKAIDLYTRFFAMEKAESSTTWRLQTEEKLRADTLEAWARFPEQLIGGIAERLKGYMTDRKAESVKACLQALGSEKLRAAAPAVCEQALSDAFIPYMNSLSSAKTLEEAAALYTSLPTVIKQQDKRQDAERAMLAAMTKEVDRLKENGQTVAPLVSWVNKLKVRALYDNGSPLVKKAATDFYEACTGYIRDVLQNDRHDRAFWADALTSMLPEDIIIARNNEKTLHNSDLVGVCLSTRIRKQYETRIKNVRSKSEAARLGKELYDLILDNQVPGANREDILANALRNLIVLVQQTEMDREYQCSFFDCYDDNLRLADPKFSTVGKFKEMIGFHFPPPPPPPPPSKGLLLLKKFTETQDGTEERFTALSKLIDYALEHPDEDVQGTRFIELVDKCCMNSFIGALNMKNADKGNEFILDAILSLSASFLPAYTSFPAGSKSLPMRTLETKIPLTIDQGMRKKAEKARKGRSGGDKKSAFWPAVGMGFVGAISFLLTFLLVTFILRAINKNLFVGLEAGVTTVRNFGMILAFLARFTDTLRKGSKQGGKFWRFAHAQVLLLGIPGIVLAAMNAVGMQPPQWAGYALGAYGILYLILTIRSLRK